MTGSVAETSPPAPAWERGGIPLERLTDEERRVLAYASAIGKEFDFALLRAATGLPEEPLAELLERLVHQGILRERSGGERFGFVQEDVRMRIYREMTESRVRVIHRKIGEAHERLHPDPPAEVLPELGRHFFLAKVHDRSYKYNRRSAALAREALAPEIAAHHLERARADLKELPGDHREEEASLLLELGELYSLLNDDLKADRLYVEALETLPPDRPVMRALILLARAEVARVTAQTEVGREYCRESAALLEKEGHKRGLARVHRLLGRYANVMGDFETARTEGEKALELLDPRDDAREVARCNIDLGNSYSIAGWPGHIERAVRYYRTGLEIVEKMGDWHEASRACNNLAVAVGAEHPAEALEWLEKGRHYAERAHNRRMVGWTLFNGVEFELNLGNVDEAERFNREARRILEKLQDPIALQQITMNDGLVSLQRERYGEAESSFQRALRMAEDLGIRPQIAEMRLRLALLYEAWGDPDRARNELTRAEEGDVDVQASFLYRQHRALRKKLGLPDLPDPSADAKAKGGALPPSSTGST
jgi:tetratricopeptide (TPR) repeat protein